MQKLKEIGVINLGSKQAATIKSSSVQHIQYQGKTLKKLSFSKCPKLYTLSIKCTKVGTVNLRSNKRLHYMTLNSKKTGKVVYPKVSTKGWHDCCDLVETNYYKIWMSIKMIRMQKEYIRSMLDILWNIQPRY